MQPITRACCVCLAVLIWCALGVKPVLAEPRGFTGELEVVLWDALFHSPMPGHRNSNLLVQLEATDGRWQRAWGFGENYSHGLHCGLVDQGEVTDREVSLKLRMIIEGDQWNRVTLSAALAVQMKRDGAGKLAGTYDGVFKGHKIAGRATGAIKPPRPLARDFRPIEMGEHPRVLLRRHEVPALKRKLQTPLGQAYQAAVKPGDPVNLGILYALTGEKRYAEQAREVVARYLENAEDQYLSHRGGGSGSFGHPLVESALALDLCHDAWPEAMRGRFTATMQDYLPRMMRYCMVTSHPNPHPCSNYFGPGHGSAAIATLALLGEKGKLLDKPEDPSRSASIIMPADEFKPAEGVPVADLALGKMPAQWLYAGPAPRKSRNDVLGAIGGYGRARPRPGTQVRTGVMMGDKMEMTTLTFRKLPDELTRDGEIDLARIVPQGGASTTVYYTVVRADQRMIVAMGKNNGETRVWLNEVELSTASYYSLRPGLYNLLVVHATDKSAGTLSVRMESTGSSVGAAGVEMHQLEMALWEDYRAQCEKGGGLDGVILKAAEMGYQRMYQHYRLGIGDGGFQAETGSYAIIASWYPLVYAALYRNVHGRDASPWPDVTHLMVRRMMQCLIRPDGTVACQKLNSACGFDVGWVATAFAMTPPRYQPGLLWAWNTACGATDDPRTHAKLVSRHSRLSLAFAFLHYPLDMKPEHPSTSLPLAWEAPTFGHHTFRSGWEGKEEFIAQVFLKASPVCGWNHPNAGAMRMWGLGRDWDSSCVSRGGVREQESVVLLPQDTHAQGACGRLTYLKTQKDGSAVLTIDLDDVYSTTMGRRMDKNLLRWPGKDESTIHGLRALAYDYSGKSGAPALMVMVDKITGGKEKLWTWQLPGPSQGKGGRPAPPPQVKVEGNSFTLAYPDASMKATFISPPGVKITFGVDQHASGDARRAYDGALNRVKATGADPAAGDYLVVITFQRDGPPPVRAVGQGLATTVTVGEQQVRFDGEKVVLGRP